MLTSLLAYINVNLDSYISTEILFIQAYFAAVWHLPQPIKPQLPGSCQWENVVATFSELWHLRNFRQEEEDRGSRLLSAASQRPAQVSVRPSIHPLSSHTSSVHPSTCQTVAGPSEADRREPPVGEVLSYEGPSQRLPMGPVGAWSAAPTQSW